METSSGDAQIRGASEYENSKEKQERGNREREERLVKRQEGNETVADTAQNKKDKETKTNAQTSYA